MANIMSLKKLKNKPSRNGFDLSKRNIFSAKVGELLPVYCKEVIPGDKFNINVKSFTRTMPVNTAAYTRIKEYYDWFFVPTNLLWNKFNTFVTQMIDNNQHAISLNESNRLSDTHPFFTLSSVVNYVQTKTNGDTSYGGYKNWFGFNRGHLSNKLLDYLGYGDMISYGDMAEAYDVALNPFPLLAYQKIYSDYFRDSQWENNFAPSFNVDYITGADDMEIDVPSIQWYSGVTTPEKPFYNMFDLRYCNWNKDLIMGLKPRAQYGDTASVDLSTLINPNTDAQINIISGAANATEGSSVQISNYGGLPYLTTADGGSGLFNWKLSQQSLSTIANSMGLTSDKLSSAFTILALRQAEALQKWKEITQSQQQDYKAQIEAHFGVSVSDAYSERCKYIDGFSDVVDINEVTNTNITSDNIADIAGRGVGVQDGRTSFSSDVHGYLMCIYHAVPLLDYSLNRRLPKQMTKTNVVDYAIPELDKTGMVAVSQLELTNEVLASDTPPLLGFAPRYYDYKTDIDEVHGNAKSINSAWVAPITDSYIYQAFIRKGLSAGSPIDYAFFKVNPIVVDPIFAAQSQSDSSVDSDQLLTNCSFDIKCVRNLDYDGLPY